MAASSSAEQHARTTAGEEDDAVHHARSTVRTGRHEDLIPDSVCVRDGALFARFEFTGFEEAGGILAPSWLHERELRTNSTFYDWAIESRNDDRAVAKKSPILLVGFFHCYNGLLL